MGIRFVCPNGHLLNVKEHLAGKRGICPDCGAKFVIPLASSPSTTDATLASATNPATQPESRPLAPSVPTPADSVPAKNEGQPSLAVPLPPLPPASASIPAGSVSGGEPPSIVTVSPEDEAEPVALYQAYRRRLRKTQMVVAMLLLVTVIVVLIMLVWVLFRGPAVAATRFGGQRPRDQSIDGFREGDRTGHFANCGLSESRAGDQPRRNVAS